MYGLRRLKKIDFFKGQVFSSVAINRLDFLVNNVT